MHSLSLEKQDAMAAVLCWTTNPWKLGMHWLFPRRISVNVWAWHCEIIKMESILSSKAEDLDCQCWPSSLEFLKTCVCRIILPSKQKQENFVIKNSNQLQAKHCVLTFCKFRKFWPTRYQPDWSVTESIIFFELISVQENAGPEGAHKRQQTVMNDNRVCRKIPILSQLWLWNLTFH